MRAPELEGMMLGYVLNLGAEKSRTWNDQQAAIDLSGLRDESLYDPLVRISWGLLTRLVGRRIKVDAVTLFSAAKSGNMLREDDLDRLISHQTSHGLTPEKFAAVTEDHRRRIRQREISEQLKRIAAELDARGLFPAALAGQLDAITFQLARDYAPDEKTETDVAEVLDDWDRRLRGENVGGMLVMPTGIQIIDEAAKGFVPGLNMILGDPGIGKSAAIASIIEAQLERQQTVGLFGLEEGYRWITKRLIARELGMSVGDVGIERPTPEQAAKLGDVGKKIFDLYQGRFLAYRHDSLGIDELCRRAVGWIVSKNCQAIYVDHIGEIRHRRSHDAQGDNWAVADSYRRLRDLGLRYSVPVIALAHRKPDAIDRPGPPKANDIGLTGEALKMVRRLFALWRKGSSLRLTVLKNNEGEIDQTVELERLHKAALIAREGGRKISMEQEEREDRAKKREIARENAAENTLWREKWNAERKGKAPKIEPKPEEPKPQASLLEVPPSKKPEPTK